MGEQQQPQQGYSSVNTLRSLAIIAKSTIRQGVHERGNTFCGENHFNIMQTFELNEPDHWKMATSMLGHHLSVGVLKLYPNCDISLKRTKYI